MQRMMRTGWILLAVFGMACSQDASVGVVLGDKVQLRKDASTTGEVLAVLEDGSELVMLEAVGEPVAVGRLRDRWERVRLADGREGFVFGAYLFPLDDLGTQRWTAISPSGDSVHRYSFRADGSWLNELHYPYNSPGYGAARQSGTFRREGRRIVFRLEHAEPETAGEVGATWAYWLYRAEGEAVLADRRQAVGEMPGEEDTYLIRERR